MPQISGKPRVHILVPTFQPNDAVGNDVAGMYAILREAGYRVTIFAEHIHHTLASITRKADRNNEEYWRDSDAILIYHHAILWELGEQILAGTRNKIVIKYHNVTPPEFFANYAQHYYWACIKGKEATARLAQIPDTLIWGDSQYNADEFVSLGVAPERCRVLPPVHKIEDLAREPFDNVVLGAYRETPNILFVGGLRPNKGHAKALEVLAALQTETAVPARLFFVGNFDPNLARYTEDLTEYVKHLDLVEDVTFAHSVTSAQLRSYYMTASVFLCVSEHEGFCVPLVEAMAFRVPVAAWATTAVKETAGGCGRMFDRFDPSELASAVAEFLESPETSREFAERGRARYEEVFHMRAIERKLLELVDEVARQ